MEISKVGMKNRSPDGLSLPNQNTILTLHDLNFKVRSLIYGSYCIVIVMDEFVLFGRVGLTYIILYYYYYY